MNKAGLKLSIRKFDLRPKLIRFLEKTNSSACIAPIEKRVTDYLAKLKPSCSVKVLQQCLGIVHFYRLYKHRLADKTCCFQKPIKKDVPFKP